MCTRPLRIRNNSILRDSDSPVYYTVPCGKCPECLKKMRDSYELRAWYEFQECKKVWPDAQWYFLTLTYNNDCVPYYVDEFTLLDEYNESLTGFHCSKRKYCCDFSDVQKMLKLLRKELSCGIRYFCTVEFGEKRGRVHYHMILIVESSISDISLTNIIQNRCWVKYENKKPVCSRGFVKNVRIKMNGEQRKDFNCVRYVCKYITKYEIRTSFSSSQSLRVRCSLGFGLGPQHTVPFTSEQLERGFVLLPYSQTNRYYIPDIYYNSFLESYENLKKNARYVEYVKHIDELVHSRFFDCERSTITDNDVRNDIAIYLHSKRFPTPEYQSIKFNRLVYSFKQILAQIPNLYLTNYLDGIDDKIDYKETCRKIASKYTEDDLLDCMLYVLPFLDRRKDGFYLPTGIYVTDKSIYSDVTFLFNCLTFYIKSNQHDKDDLKSLKQKEDEKKSYYFNSLYYEKINLDRACESSQRQLRFTKSWNNPRCFRYHGLSGLSRDLSTSYCPF